MNIWGLDMVMIVGRAIKHDRNILGLDVFTGKDSPPGVCVCQCRKRDRQKTSIISLELYRINKGEIK